MVDCPERKTKALKLRDVSEWTQQRDARHTAFSM